MVIRLLLLLLFFGLKFQSEIKTFHPLQNKKTNINKNQLISLRIQEDLGGKMSKQK